VGSGAADDTDEERDADGVLLLSPGCRRQLKGDAVRPEERDADGVLLLSPGCKRRSKGDAVRPFSESTGLFRFRDGGRSVEERSVRGRSAGMALHNVSYASDVAIAQCLRRPRLQVLLHLLQTSHKLFNGVPTQWRCCSRIVGFPANKELLFLKRQCQHCVLCARATNR
jgi:hypothetical protein